jgi:arabinofuranosyltransferase
VLLLAVVAVVFLITLGVSYLDEDAFISFRVVDNFVHGHGLRWNVDERVQVFTNPLWVLALIPLHAILPDISWASYLLSAVASTAAVAVIARRLTAYPMLLVLGLLLPLTLSSAFTDYTSSGLENPFVYLFAALFVERLLRHPLDDREASEVPWFELSLFAALAACTRLDSFLLFAPALVWLSISRFRTIAWAKVALGASPLLAWLGFALFYYGTVFPNPKYAKLNGGVPIQQYWKFGRAYLLDLARNDVVTFAVLLATVIAAVICVLAIVTRRSRRPLDSAATMLGCGVGLHMIYVVYVGGDFMAGRHFAAPFLVSVSTLALTARSRVPAHSHHTLLALAVVLLGLRFGLQPITAQKDVMGRRGQQRYAIVRDGEIRDQRFNASYYETLFGARGPASKHEWSITGIKHAKDAARLAKTNPEAKHVVVLGGAGKGPYYAGPSVIFVDRLGLADPLLARLPDADGEIKMIGHLRRKIPKGYVDARKTGDLGKMDPQLRPYYVALRSITSDPLFDAERLRRIWAMNTGAYDAQLAAYIADGYRKQKK